jgi:hypothetical protein
MGGSSLNRFVREAALGSLLVVSLAGAVAAQPAVPAQVLPQPRTLPPANFPYPKFIPNAPAEKPAETEKAAQKPAETGKSPDTIGEDPEPKSPDQKKPLYDSLHLDEDYGLKSLFDSLHPRESSGKKWYEKLSIRGYTQVRYGRSFGHDSDEGQPTLLGDRSIDGNRENFSIRRARLILSGDVSDHMYLYFQQDFANTPPDSSTSTFFGQLRDLYADLYIDTTKVHRFRVGQSKLPYGFEAMQSSGNRVPIDRSDAIDSGVSPNQRDLGVFYYWTPVEKQELLRDLVRGGLKGTGNYGIFGLGVYNGQGSSRLEQNLNLHTVSRFTWPFRLSNGQVVEMSLQGYTGEYVVEGAEIRPLGVGPAITPLGTRQAGERSGLRDQRMAASFVYYPQPLGFQTEWVVGEGPGLDPTQTFVKVRSLSGGYVMMMYKYDTPRFGIFIPYGRYHHYRGGYKSAANAPYGNHDQYDIGVEWQIRREMELVVEYSFVDGVTLGSVNQPGVQSYRNFDGTILRAQFQFNY